MSDSSAGKEIVPDADWKTENMPCWVWLVLGGILLLGVFLRGLYLKEISRNPDFEHPAIDAAYHDHWARGLATGNWAVTGGRDDPQIYRYPFYRPPGYPYFLSLIYRLFGLGYLWPRVVQMFIGVMSGLVGFFLGRRWFGWVTGLIFSALLSTYWVFIYFEGELVDVVLSVFIGLLLLSVIARFAPMPGRRAGDAHEGDAPRTLPAGRRSGFPQTFSSGGGTDLARGLLSGLLVGGYALLRPNELLFLPVAALWVIWVLRRRWLGAVAGLFLGTVAAILPVAIRNYAVSGELVPIATNLGISLGVANNEYSDGTTHFIPGIGDIGTPFDYPRIVRHLSWKLKRDLTHSGASSYLARGAVRFLREQPGKFIRLLGRKALLFWGPREIRNLKEIHFVRKYSSVLGSIPGNFSLTVALAAVGLLLVFLDRRGAGVLAGRRREVSVLMVLFIGSYFLSMVPFAAAARYRVPVIPFLLLLGAYGMKRTVELAIQRAWARAGGAALMGLLIYTLASINWTGFEPSPEKWHHDRGLAYTESGQWDKAISEYQKAIQIRPSYAEAYTNLGISYQKAGKVEKAVESYRESLRIKPGSARTHKNLADALWQLGKRDEAMENYRRALALEPLYGSIRGDLANALYEQGKVEEAIAQYDEALKMQPDDSQLHNNLGNVFLEQNRLAEALKQYQEALRINPSYPQALYNIANLYAREGRLEEACEHYRRAVKVKPDYVDAYNNFGVALVQQGKVREGIQQYQKAIRIAPEDPAAYYNLGVTLVQQGKTEEAVGYFHQVLKLRPDYEPAQRALELIKTKP